MLAVWTAVMVTPWGLNYAVDKATTAVVSQNTIYLIFPWFDYNFLILRIIIGI